MSQPYVNITIEYVLFIKQFIAHLAFVQFNRVIYRKTKDITNYIAHSEDHTSDVFNKIFQKNIEEHLYSPTIWTEIFREPNIAIPLMYFVELYNYLSIDSEKTYSNRYIERTLFLYNSRVFAQEPFIIPSNTSDMEATLSIHQKREKDKYIQNTIIFEVFRLMDTPISENIHINQAPYYAYLERFKQQSRKNGITITNIEGNLEITSDVLQQYAKYTRHEQLEIYSIWMIDQWLS